MMIVTCIDKSDRRYHIIIPSPPHWKILINFVRHSCRRRDARGIQRFYQLSSFLQDRFRVFTSAPHGVEAFSYQTGESSRSLFLLLLKISIPASTELGGQTTGMGYHSLLLRGDTKLYHLYRVLRLSRCEYGEYSHEWSVT